MTRRHVVIAPPAVAEGTIRAALRHLIDGAPEATLDGFPNATVEEREVIRNALIKRGWMRGGRVTNLGRRADADQRSAP